MKKTVTPDLPILMIDDEEAALRSMSFLLKSNGINNLLPVSDPREVMGLLANREVSFILLDLHMPHLSGEELLSILSRDYPHIPVVIATANDEVDTVVGCMSKGAFNYIVKPISDGRLLAITRAAIEVSRLRRENERLRIGSERQTLKYPDVFDEVITADPRMHRIFHYMESVAATGQPVLITGETGVGKDNIARILHVLSDCEGEYVTVNVASLDDQIFSDTLFGHAKGAFTGADHAREGLVQKAENGTLFLDEIGDLSPANQVKLLHLVQEREYMPLGSDQVKRCNARILVATNHDLAEQMACGRFRKDLYYRLGSHKIHVPPLRERLDDLPFLVEHFLELVADELGRKKPTVPKELLTLLGTYNFPGNIRELKMLIYDAVTKHTEGVMSLEHFRTALGMNPSEPSSSHHSDQEPLIRFNPARLPTMKEARKLLIDEAMRRAKDNKTIAAQLLGVTRQSLTYHLPKGCLNEELS